MTRHHQEENHRNSHYGLTGVEGLRQTLSQRQDARSIAYVLEGIYCRFRYNTGSMSHLVLSWQQPPASFNSMETQLKDCLLYHHKYYEQALWFQHNNTSHPHIHLLLFTRTNTLKLKNTIKKYCRSQQEIHSEVSDVRQNSPQHYRQEYLHTRPLSFYQWIKLYLNPILKEVANDPQTNWHNWQRVLAYCNIQVQPRFSSTVWQTSVDGRQIHIKPSLIDREFSSHHLQEKWGLFNAINITHISPILSYQDYYNQFQPERLLQANSPNSIDSHNYQELLRRYQLLKAKGVADTLISNRSKIKEDAVQESLLCKLNERGVVPISVKKQLARGLHQQKLSYFKERQFHKSRSWIQFLIHETEGNNISAKTILERLWQNQEGQAQRLGSYLSESSITELVPNKRSKDSVDLVKPTHCRSY